MNTRVERGPKNPKRIPKGRSHLETQIRPYGHSRDESLLRDLDKTLKKLTGERFYEIKQAADAKTGPGKKLQIPKGALLGGQAAEQQLWMAYGWYWEPLLHDLAFMEEMRDSVTMISGTFNTVANLIVEGFALQHPDPEIQEAFQEGMIEDPEVDFSEVVRSVTFELLTLANSYRAPVVVIDPENGPKITFRPIRATAIRKLRDKDLNVQGYIQLLHRPSEFIFGGVPTTPTFFDKDEILCGLCNTDSWYAYGKPPMASLPFVTKIKLQMEKDVAEMLHQHVPRLNITYVTEEQQTQQQVNEAMADLNTKIAALNPTDSFLHTPDAKLEYAGPSGHQIDPTSAQKHIEDQFWPVLGMSPGPLGRDTTVNPIMAQLQWQVSQSLVEYIRTRVTVMLTPALKQFAKLRHLDDHATMTFKDHDTEGAEAQARTNEYNISNGAAAVQAGFIDQDTGARHATRGFKGGPVDKAAAPEALPPQVDPNKVNPDGTPVAKKPVNTKVGDSKKGPKGKNRSAPTPDKRPKGKRHEALSLLQRVMEDPGVEDDTRKLVGRVFESVTEGTQE